MITEEESKKEPLSLATSQWVHWFFIHRGRLLTTALIIATAAVVFVWYVHQKHAQEYKALQEAEALAEKLEGQAQASMQETVAQLQAINDRFPAIQGRYDGLIAQELLIENQTQAPYIDRSIDRLKLAGLAHFAAFSEVAALTAQKEFAKAQEKALALKAQENLPYSLKAYLLLQITCLYRALGQKEETQEAAKELESYLRSTQLVRQDKETAEKILAHLQENDAFLLNFIKNN